MIAVSHTDRVLRLPGKHPRAELLRALGRKHSEKIYLDKPDGTTVHVGYVVDREWWTLYTPWERKACR